jgi:predicted Zn finger-like uncharacterized protein
MNIRCPNCQTAFRVDPTKIPPTGVRARCARCSATFTVSAPGSTPPADGTQSGPAAAAAGGSSRGGTAAWPQQTGAGAGAGAGAGPGAGAPARAAASGIQAREATRHATPPGAVAAEGPPAEPPGGAAATVPRPTVFGSRDPSARAQRIARALVSDIVAYHPKRRDECLAAGTLRSDFREEIMKSWEEYVAQVGLDLAKSTPYFRNALNDILARGQQIF